MDKRLVKIGEAARLPGTDPVTLRKRESTGELLPIIIHKGDQPSFEEELASDVLEIITVFSARLYGSRSKKHKKMLETLKDVARTQD